MIFSCFFRDKQEIFVTFAAENKKNMVVAAKVKDVLNTTPDGVVLTIQDFDIVPKNQPTLTRYLNLLVARDVLKKVSKGRYYKPRKTQFGLLSPSTSEVVKDFLQKGGKTKGYITGATAFAEMGLTTQISSSIMIGTNKYRSPITRNGIKISFLAQLNPITPKSIPLLRILDALKLIRRIPGSTPGETIIVIKKLVASLSPKQQKSLVTYAMKYQPAVRAMLGAILEDLGANKLAAPLSKTLSGVTAYKLGISSKILPTTKNWNIL